MEDNMNVTEPEDKRTPMGDSIGWRGPFEGKAHANMQYGQGVYQSGSDVPWAQAPLPPVAPADRLIDEIETARTIYRSMSAGERVDYPRLAGMLAGCLDNIAFYASWIRNNHAEG